MSVHGTEGAINVAYPEYFYNSSGMVPLPTIWFQYPDFLTDHVIHGLSEMGIHLSGDLNTGDPTGAMMVPSSMSPTNQTRSDARTGYFDPAIPRSNLHVITGQTATRLIAGLPGSLAKEGTRRRIIGVDASPPSVLLRWRLRIQGDLFTNCL